MIERGSTMVDHDRPWVDRRVSEVEAAKLARLVVIVGDDSQVVKDAAKAAKSAAKAPKGSVARNKRSNTKVATTLKTVIKSKLKTRCPRPAVFLGWFTLVDNNRPRSTTGLPWSIMIDHHESNMVDHDRPRVDHADYVPLLVRVRLSQKKCRPWSTMG